MSGEMELQSFDHKEAEKHICYNFGWFSLIFAQRFYEKFSLRYAKLNAIIYYFIYKY